MGILPRLWFRLCSLFRRKTKEDDLEEELSFHLEMATLQNIDRGMDPATARREAYKEFGGIEQHKEDVRDSWKVRIITDILRDIRFGARPLWKNKIFSATIILTLGICIGANSAIFTILNALVLHPLPIYMSGSLDELVNKSLNRQKTILFFLVIFSSLSVFFTAIGIFGVLTYNISQRTRELGIRCAIGATPRQILTLVLREGISKIVLGLIIGLVGAYFLSPLIDDFLFETFPRDPVIFFIAPLFLFLVALTASYLPARRATKLNPVEALRYE
jgi:ABC-type antimicrobial peptide transport system permease subunit